MVILAATVVSGATGYLVTGLVAAGVSVSDYTSFAVFWSALFLIVGALGGVQHELARATSPQGETNRDANRDASPAAQDARPFRFAVAVAAIVAAALAATSPLWAPILFPTVAIAGPAALIVGAVGYVLVAASCGVMYGIAAWKPLAVMIAVDGVVRLVVVSTVLLTGADVTALLWAVSVPFLVTVVAVLPFVAYRLRRVHLDVGYRALSANTGRIVVASAATATLIAGFPVLLRASDPAAPESVIGPLILVLTLTRAPLVIPVMAMQSYLVVSFQANAATARRRAGGLVLAVLAAAGLLAVLLGVVGTALFSTLFGSDYALDGLVIAGLVASSGFVAALAVTGPALLARSQHSAVTAGWLVAVGTLVVVLWMPVPVVDRALIALAVGPALGLIVHVVALLWPRAALADNERGGSAL